MKISKALKLKNSIVKEMSVLRKQVEISNSYETRNPPKYNSSEKLTILTSKTRELAEHKAKIARANRDIYKEMFLIAELKGLMASLENISTREGVELTPSYRGEPIQTTYKATLDQKDIDTLKNDLTKEIETLQDQIDEYNATHSIE